MKWTRIFLGALLALGLLAGCGGSSDPVVIGGCVTDAECDDGDFCTTGRCVAGTCIQFPTCDDGNPCTTNECRFVPGQGYSCLHTCSAAGPADPCCNDAACADKPVCVGETYEFRLTGLSQAPPACILPFGVPALILELVKNTQYNVTLPSAGSEFTEVDIDLPIPVIGPITVTARKVAGELVFDPVDIEPIDLSDFLPADIIDLLNLNCLVGGTAEGLTNGFGEDELDVTITLSNLSKTEGSGAGECGLNEPGPACVLQALSEGTVLPPR